MDAAALLMMRSVSTITAKQTPNNTPSGQEWVNCGGR